MADPRSYQFNLPAEPRPELFQLEEEFFPGIQQSWPNCTTARRFHPIEGIRAVVIHATAGSSSAGAVSVMHAGRASFHWLVPDENEPQHGHFAWACAPETLAAWHVRNSIRHPDVAGGENLVNHWSLGIEVVNAQRDSDTFSEWQVSMTARIVRFCWAKYPNLKHVVSHAKLDPERRTDPGSLFPWKEFERQVLEGRDQPPPPLVASVPALESIENTDTRGCCTG